MTLDLDELTVGWDCPPGELRARALVGRDGQELLQLRIDLGVMQMFLDGRPDGQRYRGLPSARAYIEHEQRVGGNQIVPQDWQELERELLQTNYRRMALATLAEDALRAGDERGAARYLDRALSDIEECLAALRLLRRAAESTASPEDDRGPRLLYPSLPPTLVFDRARLGAQLRIIEGQFEEAVEEVEVGAEELDALLVELGYDHQQRAEDPGLRYLQGLGLQLRREYGIAQTLRQQLQEAIEQEDFEAAARLRDELQRRRRQPKPPPDG